MSVILLSWFKESGVVYIFLKILVLWHVRVFRGEAVSSKMKKTVKYWYKIFLLKHIARFGIWKNCINKLSIKMLIKKPKAVKVYAYQMLLSFKTSVTYIYKKITSCRTNTSIVKEPSLNILEFLPDFVRCPILIFRFAEGHIT